MIARVAMALPIDGVGERLAVVADDRRAGLQAAVGEQDVAGDDDRSRVRLVRDPIVGGIELVRHHNPLDQRMVGDAQMSCC